MRCPSPVHSPVLNNFDSLRLPPTEYRENSSPTTRFVYRSRNSSDNLINKNNNFAPGEILQVEENNDNLRYERHDQHLTLNKNQQNSQFSAQDRPELHNQQEQYNNLSRQSVNYNR